MMLAGESAAQSGVRQTAPPASIPATAGPVADPAASPPEPAAAQDREGGRWLFRSGLFSVTKPEIKAPTIEWDGQAVDQAAAEGKNHLLRPIYRVRDAARSAVTRAQAAWNSTAERMKFGPDGAAPPMLGRWLAGDKRNAPAVAQQPTDPIRR